jgi:hypothetical protein
MTANILFLRNEYLLAKLKFRELLSMDLKPKLQSQVLNNLAFVSFAHVLDIPRLRETFPDKVQFEQLAKQIITEETYTRSYLLESIETNEKGANPDVNQIMLQELLSLNLEPTEDGSAGSDFSESQEAAYFELLKAPG